MGVDRAHVPLSSKKTCLRLMISFTNSKVPYPVFTTSIAVFKFGLMCITRLCQLWHCKQNSLPCQRAEGWVLAGSQSTISSNSTSPIFIVR